MKNLYLMVLATFICLVFAPNSNGETDNLVNLLKDKAYWKDYNWDEFDNSLLFKTVKSKVKDKSIENGTIPHLTDILFDSYQMTLEIINGDHKRINLSSSTIIESDYINIRKIFIAILNAENAYYDGSIWLDTNKSKGNYISHWVVGNTTITLNYRKSILDGKITNNFISITYENSLNAKIYTPRKHLMCKLSYYDVNGKMRGRSDVIFHIDENLKYILTNFDYMIFSKKVTFTEDNIHFESIPKPDTYPVKIDYNRSTQAMTGEMKAKELLKIEGECEKYK